MTKVRLQYKQSNLYVYLDSNNKIKSVHLAGDLMEVTDRLDAAERADIEKKAVRRKNFEETLHAKIRV